MGTKRKIEFNKKLLIVVLIIILLYIVLSIYNNKVDEKYNSTKINANKYYIYTKYHSDKNDAYVPYINLKGKDASKVNEEIITTADSYLKSTDEDKTVTYRYNQSKNVISVVMMYRDRVNDQLKYTFKTYVFDLNRNSKLLTDEEILKAYKMNRGSVGSAISDSLKEKYEDEVNQGYLNRIECDFECYLKLRDIKNLAEDANYYIENSHLVVYRSFNPYSIYNEERYFKRSDFKFIIK